MLSISALMSGAGFNMARSEFRWSKIVGLMLFEFWVGTSENGKGCKDDILSQRHYWPVLGARVVLTCATVALGAIRYVWFIYCRSSNRIACRLVR